VIRILFILGAVWATGCASRAPDARSATRSATGSFSDPDLAYVEFADPVEDVNRAVAAGDFRFVAIDGLGRFVPFIDDNYPEMSSALGDDLKVVRGTSDFNQSYWEEKVNAIARVYAENYNLILFERLEELKKLPKGSVRARED